MDKELSNFDRQDLIANMKDLLNLNLKALRRIVLYTSSYGE